MSHRLIIKDRRKSVYINYTFTLSCVDFLDHTYSVSPKEPRISQHILQIQFHSHCLYKTSNRNIIHINKEVQIMYCKWSLRRIRWSNLYD